MLRSRSRKFWKGQSRKIFEARRRSWSGCRTFCLRLRNPAVQLETKHFCFECNVGLEIIETQDAQHSQSKLLSVLSQDFLDSIVCFRSFLNKCDEAQYGIPFAVITGQRSLLDIDLKFALL